LEEWFRFIGSNVVIFINFLAMAVVLIGAVQAFMVGLRDLLMSATRDERRQDWVHFLRWLVAGLTFQLAADIVETSISFEWNAVGRLAAIAAIRTFLNFFLERDLDTLRESEKPGG
jgi:uncharacterized membrane protein